MERLNENRSANISKAATPYHTTAISPWQRCVMNVLASFYCHCETVNGLDWKMCLHTNGTTGR